MATISILFAGGGTGGHLFPALAVADEIRRRKPDAQITFIGTKKKLEARIVPQRGYRFYTIWISGLRRSWSIEMLLFPLKVLVAFVQSFFLIREIKPDVVVGTGGYVSGPPLCAAVLMGIPTVIQEQNSFPGATTRLLSPWATQVHVAFEATRALLKHRQNIVVSGNPTAVNAYIPKDAGAKMYNLDPSKKTLLVFGGSLGAASINRAVAGALAALRVMNIQIIWQTGEQDYERISRLVRDMGADREQPWVRVYKFIETMPYAYAACDLVVCRAGATTLAELTSRGVPAVLVPYPFAAADHQRRNAEMMARSGAAVLLHDADVDEHLLETVRELLVDERRRAEMAQQAKALGRPEAASTIADAVLTLAGA